MWFKAGIILMAIVFAACATPRKERGGQTTEELQARVSELEKELHEKDAEIRELEDELEKPRASISTPVEPTLEEIDMSKVTAKHIQTALKNSGYYKGEIDGKIGKNSREAIREFQKANNLSVDGKVGPKTWALLQKYLER